MHTFQEPEVILAAHGPFDDAWIAGVAERLNFSFNHKRIIHIRGKKIFIAGKDGYTKQLVLDCHGDQHTMTYYSPFPSQCKIEGHYSDGKYGQEETFFIVRHKPMGFRAKDIHVVTVLPDGSRSLRTTLQTGLPILNIRKESVPASDRTGAYFSPCYYALPDGHHVWEGNGVVLTPVATTDMEAYRESGLRLGLIPMQNDKGLVWI